MKDINKLINPLKEKNIQCGYLYFYIHLITEITCFYMLSIKLGDSVYLWLCPLIYDAIAFVPQSIIGYISDKYPKINLSIIGIVLMIISLLTLNIFNITYLSIIILALGNALIHINGAEITLKSSNGKLSHSAIFVAGGSFGVIIGKLLGNIKISYFYIIFLILTTIPFILLAEEYKNNIKNPCKNYNYHNPNIKKETVILLAVLVVIIRGYMGYGIPTSWNKTTLQAIILYFSMGIGKALGGILSDIFGIRKISIISILLALPFLLIGDNIMLISIIGVMLFSMTMSITLSLLVSVLKNTPGLAFGLTTIGLFLGTLPIFIFRLTTKISNLIVITVLTFICLIMMLIITRKDNNDRKSI